MLKIDKKAFELNLSLTQSYCQIQVEKGQSDNAKIFRSYNPRINNNFIFSFEVHHFNFDIRPGIDYCTLAKWSVDLIERKNKNLIEELFKHQIEFKKRQLTNERIKNHLGDILISKIDNTVVDGASEVQSLGLFDIYDMPPIDTWFYLTKTKESRLLFAWMPEEFRYDASMAIDVNCIECIDRFEKYFPQEYQEWAISK